MRRFSNVSTISQPHKINDDQRNPFQHDCKSDKVICESPACLVATKSATHSLEYPIFQADAPHPISGDAFSLKHGVLDPQGSLYIFWLCIVSITFLYNAWVIPLRSSFPFQTPENSYVWLIMDACADFIYLSDIVLVKHRIMYLSDGFWVRDPKLTRTNYMKKLKFKVNTSKSCYLIAPCILIFGKHLV